MGFLFTTQTVFGQTEKLGIVQYTPPKGMNKLPKENLVVFSELNQTTGAYCVITLYGARHPVPEIRRVILNGNGTIWSSRQ